MEELADVQELALVIVEVYFVDPKVYTHLRNFGVSSTQGLQCLICCDSNLSRGSL